MEEVLVIGASRGIGLEFVRQYRAAGAETTATARDEAGLQRLHGLGAQALRLDVTDAASCAGLSWPLDGERFSSVIVNAGVYGPRAGAAQVPTQADFDHVMHTNVLGPMRVLPLVAEMLAPDARVAVITSRMGSIGSRSNGSGWLYRASKAAANSVMRDMAFVLDGRAICVALHPGWVRTDMGGAEADLEVGTSVTDMRRTLAALRPADHGGFFDHDGTPIPW